MKIHVFLLSFLLSFTANCQTDTVLICKGTSAYAYHNHFCAGLKNCRAKVEKVSLPKAQAMRRKPCGHCYKKAVPTSSKKKVTPAVQGQCSAITKKGTRCSRKARSVGRCWQHGG